MGYGVLHSPLVSAKSHHSFCCYPGRMKDELETLAPISLVIMFIPKANCP